MFQFNTQKPKPVLLIIQGMDRHYISNVTFLTSNCKSTGVLAISPAGNRLDLRERSSSFNRKDIACAEVSCSTRDCLLPWHLTPPRAQKAQGSLQTGEHTRSNSSFIPPIKQQGKATFVFLRIGWPSQVLCAPSGDRARAASKASRCGERESTRGGQVVAVGRH